MRAQFFYVHQMNLCQFLFHVKVSHSGLNSFTGMSTRFGNCSAIDVPGNYFLNFLIVIPGHVRRVLAHPSMQSIQMLPGCIVQELKLEVKADPLKPCA